MILTIYDIHYDIDFDIHYDIDYNIHYDIDYDIVQIWETTGG